MAKVIMRVECADGEIELLPDRVIIHRKGIFNAFKFGFNAKREIPLGAISEIGFRPAGLSLGEIDFIRSGLADKGKVRHGAVRFGRKKNEQMEKFKERVFDMINQVNNTRNKL